DRAQLSRQKFDDLTAELSSLGVSQVHGRTLNEMSNELARIDITSGKGGTQQQDWDELSDSFTNVHLEDTCSSTWKDEKTPGSVTTATLWARRGAPNEPYHLDCISFHQRLQYATPLRNLTGLFKKLLDTSEVPGDPKPDVQYMSKYYVNLKYFMPTQLEGHGLTCQQQLDRRIHQGLGDDLSAYSDTLEFGIDPAHFGEYLMAVNTVREISSNAGRQEFWDLDWDDMRRGVEVVWSSNIQKFIIASLAVISPTSMATPGGYPIHHENLEGVNEDATFDTNGPLLSLVAHGQAAAALIGSSKTYFAWPEPIFEALLEEAPLYKGDI
ncbi:hypothetical protein FOZ63_029587, partial [Perkinsus olseni]